MDVKGAVDLSLLASEVAMPEEGAFDLERVVALADEHAFGLPASVWARLQLTRLAAASVLEARLLHVKAARLGVYGLVPDPEKVTLQQLAPLHLSHNGTAGQAFEIAVADAVAVGHPEVTGLIRAGLRMLNLSAAGPLSMVVLGMEKVPGDMRDQFWKDVLAVLPADGKFRTGMRGRPANVESAISRLAELTAHDMRRSAQAAAAGGGGNAARVRWERDRVSQLARADALVACGSDLVAASLKTNRRLSRSETWRDVPLWITVGPEADVELFRDQMGPRRSPRVTVTLPAQGWFALFRDALDAVDSALDRINRDKPVPAGVVEASTGGAALLLGWDQVTAHVNVSHQVERTLWLWRRKSIADVAAELRRAHEELRSMAGGFALGREQVEVTSLDVPELVQAWQTDADDAKLFVPQQHLFRPLVGREATLLVP